MSTTKGIIKRFPLAGVKQIIVVASGKGGVGKSTVAVNLALATARVAKPKKIGLLDADIYGPSLSRMMNLNAKPTVNDQRLMVPLSNFDVKCMSMGFLSDEKQPAVWRGLMVMSAVNTLLRKVAWGPLDYLFIDMPPGTGDVHLTITESVPVNGVVIVSTAQDIALIDARKGAEMFRKLVPPVTILGIVENMATMVCAHCSKESRIFGSDTKLRKIAEDFDVDVLGSLPFYHAIVSGSDNGKPIVVAEPNSEASQIFLSIAEKVVQRLPEWKDPFSKKCV